MTVVIGLSGKAKSGKNSVVHLSRIALDDYKDPPVKVHSVAFADPLKEMAHRMVDDGTAPPGVTHGDIDDKTPAGRKFLQDLGMEKRREDPLYWVKLAAERVELVAEERPAPTIIYVPDVRFKNEADFVKARGWLLWRVRRPVVEPLQARDTHPSETELDGYWRFDDIIVANDMRELFAAVDLRMGKLGLK